MPVHLHGFEDGAAVDLFLAIRWALTRQRGRTLSREQRAFGCARIQLTFECASYALAIDRGELSAG